MELLDVIPFIQGMDYFAIFLLTFVSAILIIVPVPYFPVLITAILITDLDPNLIAVVGAIGAVIAKTIIYMISYYGTNYSKVKKRFNPSDYPETNKMIQKYGGLTIFIAGITPIPDNIIYIPFGIYKYSPIKFVTITFLSKIILNVIVVWGTVIIGKPIIGNFSNLNLDVFTLIIAVIFSIILFSLLFFFFLKINWARVLENLIIKAKSLKLNKR